MASKTGDQVANRLLSRIVDGQYGPQGRLPSERDLVSEMEVSRASVREALHLLHQWGVVAIRPGSGAQVRPAAEWQLDVLRAAPEQPSIPWDNQQAIVDELIHLRRTVYLDVAERLGRTGVSEAVLRNAKDAAIRAYENRDQPAVFARLELGPIRILLEGAGMLPSVWMLNQLAAVYGPVLGNELAAVEAANRFWDCHCRLFEAIREQSPLHALQAVESYLNWRDETRYEEAA